MSHLYPLQLPSLLTKVWARHLTQDDVPPPKLPSGRSLEVLLSIVYHTSLLKEEGRHLSFRVIAWPKIDALKPTPVVGLRYRFASFDEPKPLSIAELRRLAPAIDSRQSMLCVQESGRSNWEIWGIYDSGLNWWKFNRHETGGTSSLPPDNVAVTSNAPGELVISSGTDAVLVLRSGAVHYPRPDLLESGLINKRLERPRMSLYRAAANAFPDRKYDPDGVDDGYPHDFYDHCLSRVLQAIQDTGHGGALILISHVAHAMTMKLRKEIVIKYPCSYPTAWDNMVNHLILHRKFHDLHLPMWQAEMPIDPEHVREQFLLESQLEDANDGLTNWINFVGSLSAVDGALVMTDRFVLLGFGAEILSQCPSLQTVFLATDPGGKVTKPLPIESYGTRHRSAFRFAFNNPSALVFVVSQDGGLKAIRRTGRNVVMWPNASFSIFGCQ